MKKTFYQVLYYNEKSNLLCSASITDDEHFANTICLQMSEKARKDLPFKLDFFVVCHELSLPK